MADSKLIWASTRPEDGGVFWRAPLGTSMPTLADAPWDDLTAPWEDHGWMGKDGIVNDPNRDTTDHQAFGGDIVKVTYDKYVETLKVTCLESNETVLKSVFGEDNVTVVETAGHRQVTVKHSSLPPKRYAWLGRVIDGEKTRLLRVREGEVKNVDGIKHVNDDLLQFTITIQCYKPDENTEAVDELIDEADVPTGS